MNRNEESKFKSGESPSSDDLRPTEIDWKDEIIVDAMFRIERGENPDSVLQSILSERPDLKSELQERFQHLLNIKAGLQANAQTVKLPQIFSLGAGDVAGDFKIVRQIAIGGMGVVYEANQQNLDRRVAIKFLKHPILEDRFANEQRFLGKFFQANIVPIYETGVHEKTPFLIMPYVDGVALDQIAKIVRGLAGSTTTKVPSVGELVNTEASAESDFSKNIDELNIRATNMYFRSVAQSVAEIADAIADCHRIGVVHRDLKPDNVMIDKEGHAFIIDFGLAAELENESDSEFEAKNLPLTKATRTGVVGSPIFRAPEQNDSQWDTRTDVWGIGC